MFDDAAEIDGKTNYESAVINTMWFDFDDNKDVNKCKQMFKGYKKIYTPVLQTTKDYPKDISYRGKGLSNEYRLPLPSGLTKAYKERFN